MSPSNIFFMLACLLFVHTTRATPPAAPWFPVAPPLPATSTGVLSVSSTEELFNAVKKVEPGGTILLQDGRYRLDRYLDISTDGVTVRSASGDRHAVVLDGSQSRHGELIGFTGCTGVTLADLTVQNIKWNGIKINSDKGANAVTIYNCVIHNVWQRGIKGPSVPADEPERRPRNCRVQYCLFYNDRPKQFSDDETDTSKSYNGNYIAGMDIMHAVNWDISDNVFIGIQGRTREGRASVFLWRGSQQCRIERNLFIHCDHAIALGNPSNKEDAMHATDCIVRNNQIINCPENGIFACHTRNCQITNNTIYESESKRQRLIRLIGSNSGMQIKNNLLIGPAPQIQNNSEAQLADNRMLKHLADAPEKTQKGIEAITTWWVQKETTEAASETERMNVGRLSPEVLTAMKKLHAGFDGQEGYVAQFGDSITYSMAFWSAMSWDDPSKYLSPDDGLARAPGKNVRWRDYIKGARDKGPKFGNYSGWKIDQLLPAAEAVLAREKPMAAIIMIGTNDISPGQVPASYAANLEKLIEQCLAAHCMPILNTIPPRRDREEAVEEANRIIRELALRHTLPLADFHAECLRLRPGTSWDGTLISKDGVHPSGGKSNDYSEENLKQCGYALRNWVNFLVLRQLVANDGENTTGNNTPGK